MSGSVSVARALAAALRKLDRRTWTLVEYDGADWTNGFCTGERVAAWKAAAALKSVDPPAMLPVPFAQFCVDGKGARVLVERTTKAGTGVGEIYGLEKEALAASEVLWRR